MSDALQQYQRSGRTTRALHYTLSQAIEGHQILFLAVSAAHAKQCADLALQMLDASMVSYVTSSTGAPKHDLCVRITGDHGGPLGSIVFSPFRREEMQPKGRLVDAQGRREIFDPSVFEADPQFHFVLCAYHAFDAQWNQQVNPDDLARAAHANRGLRLNAKPLDDGYPLNLPAWPGRRSSAISPGLMARLGVPGPKPSPVPALTPDEATELRDKYRAAYEPVSVYDETGSTRLCGVQRAWLVQSNMFKEAYISLDRSSPSHGWVLQDIGFGASLESLKRVRRATDEEMSWAQSNHVNPLRAG